MPIKSVVAVALLLGMGAASAHAQAPAPSSWREVMDRAERCEGYTPQGVVEYCRSRLVSLAQALRAPDATGEGARHLAADEKRTLEKLNAALLKAGLVEYLPAFHAEAAERLFAAGRRLNDYGYVAAGLRQMAELPLVLEALGNGEEADAVLVDISAAIDDLWRRTTTSADPRPAADLIRARPLLDRTRGLIEASRADQSSRQGRKADAERLSRSAEQHFESARRMIREWEARDPQVFWADVGLLSELAILIAQERAARGDEAGAAAALGDALTAFADVRDTPHGKGIVPKRLTRDPQYQHRTVCVAAKGQAPLLPSGVEDGAVTALRLTAGPDYLLGAVQRPDAISQFQKVKPTLGCTDTRVVSSVEFTDEAYWRLRVAAGELWYGRTPKRLAVMITEGASRGDRYRSDARSPLSALLIAKEREVIAQAEAGGWAGNAASQAKEAWQEAVRHQLPAGRDLYRALDILRGQ